MKLFLLCLIAGCAMAIPAGRESDGDVYNKFIPTPDYMEEGAPSEFFMKEMRDVLANKSAAEIQTTGKGY